MKQSRMARKIGAILLIAGTTIGAAMLALPVSLGRTGICVSIIELVAAWAIMLFASFYIIEMNSAIKTEHDGGFLTISEKVFGTFGRIASTSTYLFLLYALNTAYIAALISIFQTIAMYGFHAEISEVVCILPIFIVFALLLTRGIQFVDIINRIFMSGLIISFILLLGYTLSITRKMEWTLTMPPLHVLFPSFSIAICAFGFHVIIPSLMKYLNKDIKELRQVIIVGTAIPLVAYILWQIAVLKAVPQYGHVSIQQAYEDGVNGAVLVARAANIPSVAVTSEIFGFCAIITSFIGVSMSLFDFLHEGARLRKKDPNKWKIFFLTLVPPLYFALSYKQSFFRALEYAGGFGVLILLALLPAAIVYKLRYSLNVHSNFSAPGGKKTIMSFMTILVLLICIEFLCKIGMFG